MEENSRPNFGKLIFISINFLMLFTSYNSAQNMIAESYSKLNFTNLGRMVLFSIYLGLCLNCLFAPALCRKLGFKASLVGGSFTYSLTFMIGALVCYCPTVEKTEDRPFYCTNENLIYSSSIFFGILNGAGGAVLWCAQSGYVSSLGSESIRGTYFGIFGSIFQASQIIGNVLSVAVLNYFSPFIYFLVLSGLGICATVFFCFISGSKMEGVEDEQTDSIAKAEETEPTLGQKVLKIWHLANETKMKPIMVQMLLSGCVIAFFSGYMGKITKNTLDLTKNTDPLVAAVFIALGTGEVLAGLIFGPLADKLNKVNLTVISNMAIEGAFLLSLLAIFTKSYLTCFFAAFAWGISDNSMQVMIGAYLSKDWNGKLEGFALYRVVQSLGACIGFIITTQLTEAPLYVFIFIMIPVQIFATSTISSLNSPETRESSGTHYHNMNLSLQMTEAKQ